MSSFILLRLYRNHSALLDSLHAPTQPYTTTYLSCPLLCHSNHAHPVSLSDSEIPLVRPAVLTGWLPSFHSIRFQDSFDAAYLQDSSCQWFTYLPGFHSCTSLGVLWKGVESNHRPKASAFSLYHFRRWFLLSSTTLSYPSSSSLFASLFYSDLILPSAIIRWMWCSG